VDDAARFRLLGRYKTPRFKCGEVVRCELRGPLVVCGLSAGPIRWPVGRRPGRLTGRVSLVLCGDLVKAVWRESGVAVAHWWGVSAAVIVKWRQALGLGVVNEGGRILRRLASGEARRGKRLGPESLRRVREANCRRCGLPPTAARLWTAEEDEWVQTLPTAEVVRWTGRTAQAVYKRRYDLRVEPVRKAEKEPDFACSTTPRGSY